jgi:acetyl-CoA C-acetyltransferase
LGTAAVKGALEASGVAATDIQENFFGCVIQAGMGQAPDRQVILGAGASVDTPSTCINKVCASGMKSVMLGAQAIKLGDRDIVMTGGMENMSKIPHYQYSRVGTQYGHGKIVDGIMHDGLTDVYNNILMGSCVEKTNTDMSISREAQDEYAIMSYNRARAAQDAGIFKNEIVNLSMTDRRGNETIID